MEPPEARLAEAPDAWQNLDLQEDGVPGTSADRALRELLADRVPRRTVVVAVIDGGVDTAHVDLRDALWTNPDEQPGNDVDDDGNGYVDDVHGWNFLGGSDGRSVNQERFEVTRLYATCQSGVTPDGYDCQELAAAFREEEQEVRSMAQQVEQIRGAMDVITPLLQQATGTEELTPEVVRGLSTADPRLNQAKEIYLQLEAAGITPETLEEVEEDLTDRRDYGLNPDFDPRPIVGDDPTDEDERRYGNADVMGPDAEHGSHVAGIVAAIRDNGVGMDGIASPNVRIMAIRAVPNGDERDKDVANAIRYAVDQGADIINMSFGKSFSPEKSLVDEAVRYADENGVLLVHAAGNDAADLEVEENYPNPFYEDGGRASNWITVGASSWKADSLAAPFSNYGRTRVDLFAPGVDILSTVPGEEWERNDGTSMAAPVVTGVAALLMAYFPDLDAAEVKRILLESAVPYADQAVPPPGEPAAPVAFGSLSVTGGVVNAYEAVRRALAVFQEDREALSTPVFGAGR
ncbi:MAG: S8 family peptidase [Gemmatimonadota bacterium]